MRGPEAFLALEDGTIYEGTGFGAVGECDGEVVFTTAMSGYQEILTDPSFCGQIVTMTYPLIGNYGVVDADMESDRIWARALGGPDSSVRKTSIRVITAGPARARSVRAPRA